MKKVLYLLFLLLFSAAFIQAGVKTNSALFIENSGQWPDEVLFLAKSNGTDAWITKSGAVYDHFIFESENGDPFKGVVKGHVVAQNFIGSQNLTGIITDSPKQYYYNYFSGRDQSKWAKEVKAYEMITVKGIYDGIDIQYYFEDGLLRYDYIIEAGSDIDQIKFRLDGMDDYSVNERGELEITTQLGTVTHGKLYAYLDDTEVECGFKLKNGNLTITAGSYDHGKNLTIDPLVYSTFLGGNGQDMSYCVKADDQYNTYLAGFTRSSNFPTSTGAYQTSFGGVRDAFISKLSAEGDSLIWSTNLGGSGEEICYDFEIDDSGYLYLAGYTSSSGFPVTSGVVDTTYGGGKDAFVVKLNNDGTSLVYSTLLGDTQDDIGYSIILHDDGKVTVGGLTKSTSFPTTAGVYQTSINTSIGDYTGFVTKLNSTAASIDQSTFMIDGWSDMGQFYPAFYMDTDANGNIYAGGISNISAFATTANAYQTTKAASDDAVIVKISSDMTSLLYSSFLGGNNVDYTYAIDVEGTDIIVGGLTVSTNFPVSADPYQSTYGGNNHDGFVTILSTTDSSMIYSTYYGGNANDAVEEVISDGMGRLFITGSSHSSNLYVTEDAYQSSVGGHADPYLFVFEPETNNVIYSSYFGGWGNDFGYGLFIDDQYNAYLTGGTDSRQNTPYPTTAGSYQTTYGGGDYDGFLTKVSLPIEPEDWIWNISVTDETGTDGSATLTFGKHAEASDGIDSDLGEQRLPPVPPAGSFDARFILPATGYGSLIDLRNMSETDIDWTLNFQAGLNGYPVTLEWDMADLPAGSFKMLDCFGGSMINVNMKTDSTLTITDTLISSVLIKYDIESDTSFMVNAGWNIVSMPLQPYDTEVDTLFANAATAAYEFDNGYSPVTEMEMGKGYWIRYDAADIIPFTGVTYDENIDLAEGWNLIGPFDKNIVVADITTSPAENLAGDFFGFSDGYYIADTLIPGKGYWILADTAGYMTLNYSPAKRGVKPERRNSLHNISIVAKDNLSGNLFLELGVDPNATEGIDRILGESEMPPLPPAGVFDARLVLPNSLTSPKDYRKAAADFSGAVEYLLNWQMSAGADRLILDITLPDNLELTISYNKNGERCNIKLGAGKSRVVLNPGEQRNATLTVSYNTERSVELVNFEAKSSQNSINLEWKTSKEEGLKGFEIGRSEDNVNFGEIGYIDGHGTGSGYNFSDENITGSKYYYRLKMVNSDGSYSLSEVIEVSFIPEEYSLAQNFPNPFNPSTKIKFALPVDAKVTLTLYNTLGQKISTITNKNFEAGVQTIEFTGSELASGMYIYQLTAKGADGSSFTDTKKLMLLK